MPDLVCHLSVAYFVKKLTNITKYSTIFYAGTILPDILTRPVYILWPELHSSIVPLHAPLVFILVCLLITYLFEEKNRGKVFIYLLVGGYLHLFLDLFGKEFFANERFNWFFPFSSKGFNIGLYWSEEALFAIPFLITIIITCEVVSYKKRLLTTKNKK